jgi:hypothetical protein
MELRPVAKTASSVVLAMSKYQSPVRRSINVDWPSST